MIRRLALLLPLVLVWASGPVSADGRVPAIPERDLPAVGTCAPIEAADVTHVRVGPREDITWFEVAGIAEPMQYRGLVDLLKRRAGTQRPSSHSVWLTASARHAWMHALVLVKAVFEAGLYRVGVRVRSETSGQVMGFPLFISPGRSSRTGPKAGRLSVRVDALHPREVKGPSDIGHVYAAARRASERRAEFGVEKLVGKIWISPNTPLQYALSSIDLLYRGGCDGVNVQLSLRHNWRGLNVVPVVEIQGGVASRHPQALQPPPVRPRSSPWGLEGANAPGWVDFQVEDLPSIDAQPSVPGSPKAATRPNYAAAADGVPRKVLGEVDWQVRRWAHGLGTDLATVLRGRGALAEEQQRRFAVAQRRKEALPDIILPLRRMFSDATAVVPYALQLSAFLFDRGQLRARADVTITLNGDRVRVIFGSWRPLDPKQPLTLVPFGVDPFVAGDPAALRVWFEGMFQGVRAGGVSALPLAAPGHLLPSLPVVAHAGTTRALAGRTPQLNALAAQLARTSYDRVVLDLQRATASVLAGTQVVGVLDLMVSAEEHELRVAGATGRRAP